MVRHDEIVSEVMTEMIADGYPGVRMLSPKDFSEGEVVVCVDGRVAKRFPIHDVDQSLCLAIELMDPFCQQW